MARRTGNGAQFYLRLRVLPLRPGVPLLSRSPVKNRGLLLEIHLFTSRISLPSQFLQETAKLLSLGLVYGLLQELLDAGIVEKLLKDGKLEIFQWIGDRVVVRCLDSERRTGRVMLGRGELLRLVMKVHRTPPRLCPAARDLLLH